MPTTTIVWEWDEAFDKFGFGDGDGPVMTDEVVDALRMHGYDCVVDFWGMHNTVIWKITKDDEVVFDSDNVGEYEFGYDSARLFLPEAIVKILDEAFPD